MNMTTLVRLKEDFEMLKKGQEVYAYDNYEDDKVYIIEYGDVILNVPIEICEIVED